MEKWQNQSSILGRWIFQFYADCTDKLQTLRWVQRLLLFYGLFRSLCGHRRNLPPPQIRFGCLEWCCHECTNKSTTPIMRFSRQSREDTQAVPKMAWENREVTSLDFYSYYSIRLEWVLSHMCWVHVIWTSFWCPRRKHPGFLISLSQWGRRSGGMMCLEDRKSVV